MISKKTIDEVLYVAQVDEVIEDFMTLKRKGANYEGLCPFHDEKTPSFKVNPVKGIFKCFGCGKAGGAVQFVMEHEGMSFVDAIKYLCNKYGIEVIEDRSRTSEEYDEKTKKREALQAAMAFAGDFYERNLRSDEGKTVALSYLKERGFTAATIAHFGLGFAPDGFDRFLKEATQQAFNTEVLKEAGLIKQSEKGHTFDFFRNRVMFPFYNVAGKIVAFGGRVIGKVEQGPKYLNSPETDLYIKSKTLYGLFQAKQAIKKEDECILVEGYTDVISLYQSGIMNVVASSGTSLTPQQAALIARFSQNVTLLYDGDAAGLKASLRGINILLTQGLQVRIVMLQEGEDPDSFAQKNNLAQIQDYLNQNKKDFIIFKSELLYREAGNDPIKKANANAEVIQSIALVPNPLHRAQYVQEFTRISGLNPQVIQAEVLKHRKQDTGAPVQQLNEQIALIQQHEIDQKLQEKDAISTSHHEKNVMIRLIKYGEREYDNNVTVAMMVVQNIQNDQIEIQDPLCKTIFDFVLQELEEGNNPDFRDLAMRSEPHIATFIANALDDPYSLSKNWEKNDIFISTTEENYKVEVFENLLFLKLRRLEWFLRHILQEIGEEQNPEKKQALLLKWNELLEIRKFLTHIKGIVVL